MKIKLQRKIFTSASTIGEIYIDGNFECLSLEDPVREEKIKIVTAIPAGSYRIVLKDSPKFGRIMPRLENVPNFSGILIHWGNTAAHTEGCILVGKTSSKNFIGSSKLAFNSIFKKLEKAYGSEIITIDVLNAT